MMKLKKGFIQVYTGNGKGKTTAAAGLAIRAAGANLKVFFCQFLKKGNFQISEEKILKRIKNIKFIRFNQEAPFFNKNLNSEKLKEKVNKDISKVFKIISSKKFDVVILDEFTYLLNLKLVDKNSIIKNLLKKPEFVEIIITGRDADRDLIKIADLVSVIKNKKHYFNKKIFARKGIEY